MLDNLSQSASWERAGVCPCKVPRTGGANPHCPVCHGNAILWDAPIACRVSLQSMRSNREYAMLGEWEKGDIMVTLTTDNAAYDAGEYDRFTMLDASLRLDQILARGTTDVLKYTSIVSVDKVWGIIGGVQTVFIQGLDFAVAGSVLTWLTPTLPVGGQYTIVYVAHPQYYVYRDLVMDRPHGSQPLPRKVHLRLMELFSRSLVA